MFHVKQSGNRTFWVGIDKICTVWYTLACSSFYKERSIKQSMPTFTEIVAAVSDFLADYQIFLAAGAVIGLSIWAALKFVKGGR